MAKLGRGAGFAEKVLSLQGPEPVAPGNLHGDHAIQLAIAGLPHRAKRPGADLFDQFKSAKHPSGAQVGRRLVADEAECAPAGCADKPAKIAIVSHFRRLLTVETAHLHEVQVSRRDMDRSTIVASGKGKCKRAGQWSRVGVRGEQFAQISERNQRGGETFRHLPQKALVTGYPSAPRR
jgi:hypothetical protein